MNAQEHNEKLRDIIAYELDSALIYLQTAFQFNKEFNHEELEKWRSHATSCLYTVGLVLRKFGGVS